MQAMSRKRDNNKAERIVTIPQAVGAPYENRPPCPTCDDGSLAPTAEAFEGASSDPSELYCRACGYTFIATDPGLVGWAWYGYGARDGYEYTAPSSTDWFSAAEDDPE